MTWLPQASAGNGDSNSVDGSMNGDAASSRPSSRRGGAPGESARTRYISCTPLLGSDDAVGVWMVVMVENELVTGSLASRERAMARYTEAIPPTPSEFGRESPDTVAGGQRFERSLSANLRENRRGKVGSEGGRLYADFMRNGGTPKGSMEGSPPQGNGMVDGEGGSANGNGVDGFSGEGRIEELVSPTEEKGRII